MAIRRSGSNVVGLNGKPWGLNLTASPTPTPTPTPAPTPTPTPTPAPTPTPTPTPAPTPTPTPTPPWDTLTPQAAVNRTFLNATSNTLTSPYVQGLHFAQRGDIPAGTYPSLFKGATQISTQVDLVAPAYADGSLSVCSFAATIPDTLTGNGTAQERVTYQIKAVTGAAPNTPKFPLSTWGATNDMRLTFRTNFQNQSDDTANWEFKVSDCIAANIIEGLGTGSGYPLYSMRTDRSGPLAMGWRFRGYMRRKSDGAYHRQLAANVYVTAVTLTDMLIECVLEMPRAIDTQAYNALQTVGPTTQADIGPMFGIAELSNNGTVLKRWGGPTDFRAVTIPPTVTDVTNNQTVAAVDVPNNYLYFPNATTHRPRNAVGYVFQSTGALPGGMVPGLVYWPVVDYYGQKVQVQTTRAFASGAGTSMSSWQANQTIVLANYFFNSAVVGAVTDYWKQLRWFCTQAGTTGSTPPSFDGTNLAVTDGTVKWMAMNAVLTSAGSGTLTAYPVIHVFPLTETVLVDETTTDPVWTGTGPAPRIENILDLTYHLRYARALPPYDLTINPLYPDQFTGFDGHSACEPSVQSQIDDFGDNPGTNLVGYLNNTNANALLQQDNVLVQRYARSEALRWGDHWSTAEDPRAFMPIAGTNGPGNVAGQYVGLGQSENIFYFAYPNIGLNKFIGGGVGPNGNWYSAKYQKLVNASHLPAMWLQPYHKTARTIFLDMGVDLANTCMLSNGDVQGKRTRVIGGKLYCSTLAFLDQIRGQGWGIRCVDTLYDVLPANHAMRAYFNDVWQDTQDGAAACINDLRTSHPDWYNLGVMLWLEDSGLKNQLFFCGIYLQALAQAARKGRGTGGWRTICEHIAGRYFLPIFDDAGPGNAGLADFNATTQWGQCRVTAAVAGDVLTLAPVAYHRRPASTPAPVQFTVPAGATISSLTQSLVSFINATPSFTAWGLVARNEGGGYFNVRAPSALFDANNDHADACIEFTSSGATTIGRDNLVLIQADLPNDRSALTAWPSIAAMLDYNLGTGWPKSRTTDLSQAGTGTGDGQLPYNVSGWFPWGMVQYFMLVRMALATMAEAGIQGPAALGTGSTARQINDAVEARFRSSYNGPPKASGLSNGQPGNGPRTFANFDMRTFDQQAAHPNS